MGNKIITEKDFWMCTGGLVPAQLQTTQLTTKKVGDFKYITERDTATSSWIDFSCKKLMLIMALLAVAIALATVATGGAALIAICAAAAGAGAIFGAVLGSLLCGQLAAAARMWLDNKSDLIIQGQKAITGDHQMKCLIFGDTISFAPQIKNWWQAVALGTSNFIGEVLKNMMYGAAIGAGAAVITGGPAVLSQFGLSNIGANWLATWGGAGLGLRGLMGAQSMLGAYGNTGQLTGGDVAKGVFAMEVGTFHAAQNILSGRGTVDDFIGVGLWMLPTPKGNRRAANEETRRPNEETRNEEVKEEETPQARTNEVEAARPEGEHNAFEAEPTQVPGIRDFSSWFDSLTSEQFDAIWANEAARNTIKARIRHPGGLHEWLMVARADVFKGWGVSMGEIKDLRTNTQDVVFTNPPGRHGGQGSTRAHNEILEIIDNSNSYENFRDNLREWADRRLEGGRESLPEGLK